MSDNEETLSPRSDKSTTDDDRTRDDDDTDNESPRKDERKTNDSDKDDPKIDKEKKEKDEKDETSKEEEKNNAGVKKDSGTEKPKKGKEKKEKDEENEEEEKRKDVKKKDSKTEKHKKEKPKKKESQKEQEEQTEGSDGRSRQRVFFKEELRRLRDGLKKESSKIQKPPRRKHFPFVFNTLEPYYNTRTTQFLIELPEDDLPQGYSTRCTAHGLIDPWVDLRMDRELLPPVPLSARHPASKAEGKPKSSGKKRDQQSPSRKEGSTRLPKFPMVTLETKDLASKQLYYSDVPMLRRELKTKYSSQARSKVDADYKRTQQDFYRMDLDKMEAVAPGSRRHLTAAYLAYLQNTPGSRRAVNECVRSLEQKAQ